MITIIFNPYRGGLRQFARYLHDCPIYGVVPTQLQDVSGEQYHEITGHPEVVLTLLKIFDKTPESNDVEVVEGNWNGS